MIPIKVKHISSITALFCLTFCINSFGQFDSNTPSISTESVERNIRTGEQKFDFAYPESELEKAYSAPGGGFPRVILDKPVNPDEYILGVGDTLVLVVSGKIKSNILLTIGPEGKIILPDVGDLNIIHQTLTQAKNKVSSLMKKKYPNLGFELLLAEPRDFKIYVLGEVGSPGVYVSSALNRVADAIAMARGIKGTGSTRKVQIKRDSKIINADLFLFQQNGDFTANPSLLENDLIFVPLSFPRVTIGGGVKKAGVYELEGDEDLVHLVQRVGGLVSSVSYDKSVMIVRVTNRKEKETLELNLKSLIDPKAKPFLLQDGDNIFIPTIDNVPFNETNVYLTGEVKKPGAYPFLPGYTVKTYVGVAGGLTERARYSQAEIVKSDGRKIPLRDETVLEVGDTIYVPEKFIKVWQDCLLITTSISSLALAVFAALK